MTQATGAGPVAIDLRPSGASRMLTPNDTFVDRHIGPSEPDIAGMLAELGLASLGELADRVVPQAIRLSSDLNLDDLDRPRGEFEVVDSLRRLAEQNQVARSFIGCGYHDCITPPVIQRNILENPGWYTQYTPYQAEIAQGRLEALLNFQTMVADLTSLPLANASLLDEATAAAEAMAMCHGIARGKKPAFFLADHCHPQTRAVVRTRARSMGIDLREGNWSTIDFTTGDLSGVLVQYPATDGAIEDFAPLADRVHEAGARLVVAADLLALTLLRPPGEFGADIAVGSTQRFGVPMGFGGPHAAYLATATEHARRMPGRLVGISRDADGRPAYRLAVQTREQHIKREKATSNICTAQVLLAIMAGMYAVYHGPQGLRRIAERIHHLARLLHAGLRAGGLQPQAEPFFDTVAVAVGANRAEQVVAAAENRGMNLRRIDDERIGISLDETTTLADVRQLLQILTDTLPDDLDVVLAEIDEPADFSAPHARQSSYLEHPVFHEHRSEHEMLRYLHRLQGRDLSLAHSMIPLGSCTMKLNATSEMLPVTWESFARMHPYAPPEQARGYQAMFDQLERWLCQITGFAAVSLQPNAGSQGEYAGLLAIRAYHESRGEADRRVCLIPTSAHGTNPASAVIAGFEVATVACDKHGNIALDDLEAKAATHGERLGALMITYPSTHGVFEPHVREVIAAVHAHGGQVYMDGANLNAQVGLTSPAEIGADVCHLNLHKTFCIPHGGGGPGMGPIAVARHLAPFLPGHPIEDQGPVGPVSAAPFGSSSILPISWVYIALMGGAGLTRASQVAILNANYMARRLADHYELVYTGLGGMVAHEFILDCRAFVKSAQVTVEDIAKRLMDYGFHAPTMSWPVAGTLMIEPTESESRAELDRFCDALIAIRQEIRDIEEGRADPQDNLLKNAPHTAHAVSRDDWTHPYARQQAAYPVPWLRDNKFWPPVARIDNPYGDRNLVCSCPPMEDH